MLSAAEIHPEVVQYFAQKSPLALREASDVLKDVFGLAEGGARTKAAVLQKNQSLSAEFNPAPTTTRFKGSG